MKKGKKESVELAVISEADVIVNPQSFKISHADLIQLVIDREQERLENRIEEIHHTKKKLKEESVEVNKEFIQRLIGSSHYTLKPIVDFNSNSDTYIVFDGIVFNTKGEEIKPSYDNDRSWMIIYEMVGMAGYIGKTMDEMREMGPPMMFFGGFGGFGFRGPRRYRQEVKEWVDNEDENIDDEDIHSRDIYMFGIDKSYGYLSFLQKLRLSQGNIKQLKRLDKNTNALIKKGEDLAKEKDECEQQLYDLKNNTTKIKASIVTKFLNETEEGKEILKQIDSIDLKNIIND